MDDDRDVHTEHCCVIHGCKYSRDDCPVEAREKIQSFTCEVCDWEIQEEVRMMLDG